MSIALVLDNLVCRRGHRAVFSGVNLSVEGGVLVSLEGPNGSGKTSLLRLIAGFLHPASGRIIVRRDGVAIEDGEERGGLIGWLGHLDALKPQMIVREQLQFWSRLYGTQRDLDEALQRFGLKRQADVPGQYLSAGQRRRLALARLSLSERPLWLLDEPLAALDTDGKALVAEAIRDHCAAGGLVMAATHEPLGLEARMLRLGNA